MLPRLFVFNLVILLLTGCSGLANKLVPDVYLVDRHTLTEADAAGEWPKLEARLTEQTIKNASEPYAGINNLPDEQKSFPALNAEYASSESKENN